MNKKEFQIFLKENIFKLLEEETKFQIGDSVISKDGDGIIRLSKHPYYSVTLDETGVTKTFHFNELQLKEEDFGKYDINESPSEDLIKFIGILILNEDTWMTDILSSIRSIQGITIVRNEDIETINRNEKSKLHIKIDPYTFGSQSPEKIENIIIAKIKQIPGVKGFSKIISQEEVPIMVPRSPNPVPVKSIEDLKESKIKIKLRPQ